MGDTGDKDQGPSLELNLGFRRKKKQRPEANAEPAADEAAAADPAPVDDAPPAIPTVDSPASAPSESPHEAAPAAAPFAGTPAAPETSRVASTSQEVPAGDVRQDGADTAVLPPQEVTPVEAPEPTAPEPRRRREIPRPHVPGPVAAIVTGLVVGLVTVGLTWGGEQACQNVRGTTSCGGAPGFVMILVILGLMGLLGRVLLAAGRVPSPGSTSFLGVGLLAVLALVFFSSYLLASWMAIAIPVTSVVAYVVAYAITHATLDVEDDRHR